MAFVGFRLGRGLSAVLLCGSVLLACGDAGTNDGRDGTMTVPVFPPATGPSLPTAGSGATAPPLGTPTLTAGTTALPPVGGATAPSAGSGAEPPATIDPPATGQLAMDECGLTGNMGDEYCINPPPAGEGFQLHIGPADRANPGPQYTLEPGEERTDSFSTISGNTTDVYFYRRQFRMRPGAHHNIITATGGTGIDLGHRIGTVNSLSEDSPKGGMTAPENLGVGIPLAAKSPINVSLHSINTTDQPLIREIWVNFWYKPAAEVTEPVEEMFQTGSTTFAIQPGQDTILGPFNCTLDGDGRMLWMYGHRHASTRRFSTWRVRGGQRDLIYEAYNWEEPLVLEYATTVTNNTMPNEATGVEGGWNGILDLKAGDQLEWECHVVNESGGVLRFTNNTYTGEMCIVDAELVGTNCGVGLPFGG